MRRGAESESGRITVLICGLLVLALGLIAVTMSATYVTTSQRKLLALGDAAATAGVGHFVVDRDSPPPGNQDPGTGAGASGRVKIDAQAAREAVNEYLERVGATARFQELRIEEVVVGPDGLTLTVRLSATAELPLTGGLLDSRVSLETTSSARLSLSM